MTILTAEAFQGYSNQGVNKAFMSFPLADSAYRFVADPIVPSRGGITVGPKSTWQNWNLSWAAGMTLVGSAQGNGRLVAVGSAGLVVTSTDGNIWSPLPSFTPTDFADVLFDGNRFVALQTSGAVWVSPDGLTWSAAGSAPAVQGTTFFRIAYGNGQYVVAQRATTYAASSPNAAYASPDLTTWTRTLTSTSTGGYYVTGLAYGNGTFVLTTNFTHWYSTDKGVTWTQSAANSFLMGVTFGRVSGAPQDLFWAVYQNAGWTAYSYSADGITWTTTNWSSAPGLTTWRLTVTGGVLFWISSTYTSFAILPSFGGITKTMLSAEGALGRATNANGTVLFLNGVYILLSSAIQHTLDFSQCYLKYASAPQINQVSSSNGVLVAALGQYAVRKDIYAIEGGLFYSLDSGATWYPCNISGPFSAINAVASVTYGNGTWVAVADQTVLTSTDGINWVASPYTWLANATYFYVAFGNGVFMMTCTGSAVDGIRTSADGVTWKAGAHPGSIPAVQPCCIGSRWFVGGQNQTNSTAIYYSDNNGTSWTAINISTFPGAFAYFNALVSDGTRVWFLTGNNGYGYTGLQGVTAFYTTDGTNWIKAGTWAAATTYALFGIFQSGTLYYAYGRNGTVYTSPDLTTWTQLFATGNQHLLCGASIGGRIFVGATAGYMYQAFGALNITAPLVDNTKRTLYTGFSIYVPPSWIANGDSSRRLLACTFASLGTIEVRSDLSVSNALNVAASNSTRLTVGAVNYLEVGYDATAGWLRAWLNDILVFDGQPANVSTLGPVGIVGGSITGSDQIIVGNWYILDGRGTENNTRLGMQTRIVARFPQRDVSTDFKQVVPTGKPNAKVVGAPLGPTIPPMLAGDTVGNTDYYQSDDTSPSSFSKIYGVCIRSVGQNLGTAPHQLSTLMKSNNTEQAQDGALLAVPNGYAYADTWFVKDPFTNAAWTAAGLQSAQFGVRIKS
ncbi:hypothetical protein WK13_34925 [Burkholderia ubonensis]|uniref:hypothetical protein n=1 Tax=Burkholderia ubonensis TaxID=101571 RepID=UPI000751F5B6|nr:hypothetical protein [Burkholderia ubonensis]KVR21735.1 hypothetical protein WK13_34925 [Burkholderia ubonensis]